MKFEEIHKKFRKWKKWYKKKNNWFYGKINCLTYFTKNVFILDVVSNTKGFPLKEDSDASLASY